VTVQKLMGVKGFGPMKVEKYGEELVKLISGFTGQAAEPADQWSSSDDSKLLESFKAGRPLKETADALGRSPDEVWARLSALL
jgi:hypothetical protein